MTLSQGGGLCGWGLSGKGEDRLEEGRQNRVRLLQWGAGLVVAGRP